jgi:chromosome partitioning protein
VAKKVALINMKGGVGKTTVTANLAWEFAGTTTWRKKVLVVDLDPQFNASQYLLGVSKYQQILNRHSPTTWNLFEQLTHTPGAPAPKPIDPLKVATNVVTYVGGGKIDLIPSQLELSYSLKNPGQKEHLLEKLLAKMEPDYDLMLLDCAPTESILTTSAYLASDYILVPVRPEYLSAIVISLLVRSMSEFKNHYEGHNL